VYLDYDCMLNQTNIGHNNNKFYVIQIIDRGGYYSLWTRWGRVVRYYLNNMKYYLTKILLGRKRSK
jgi:poly [ADP-ribose] polymerase